MSNKTYDYLKVFALVILPALSTFYSAVSLIWGLPYHEQIVGTIAAVNVFLGSVLQASSTKYKKGEKYERHYF